MDASCNKPPVRDFFPSGGTVSKLCACCFPLILSQFRHEESYPFDNAKDWAWTVLFEIPREAERDKM